MKTCLCLLLLSALLVSSAPALTYERSDEVYNAAGKQLLEQVKVALTELSKTVPCLVGIEKAEIVEAEKGVGHWIYFTKDIHRVKATQGIYPQPNKDGIVFAIGLSEVSMLMRMTKILTLRKGHPSGYANDVNFYYSVETGQPEAEKLIVAELEKLSAPVLQSLTEPPK